MPRLFVTPIEIALINDYTKELLSDFIGQFIHYYAVSIIKTKVHDIYNEAIQKIFENPIKLPVLADQPKWETKSNKFGMEQTVKIELFVQVRDLIDKGLTLAEGDFFTYGDAVFEVVSYLQMNNIFGQEEYEVSYKIIGNLARPGQFDPKVFLKPQKDGKDLFINNPVQHSFAQKRGLKENQDGPTGDVRQVRDRLKDEMAPIALGEGPAEIKPDPNGKGASFNHDPDPPKKGFYDE